MNSYPIVTVIVPMLNEEHDIAGCIDAIGAQTWPLDRLEVLLVDGHSSDASVEVARYHAAGYGFGRFAILSNPHRLTSTSLNAGLANATGTYVARVDVRSRLQPDYIERCVARLDERPDIGVVGGSQVTVQRSSGVRDAVVARSLNNRVLMGMARYRRSAASGATDTVWMGAFRRCDLERLGGWNDRVALNEDYELNQRFRDAGQLVWFDATLRSSYLPRHSIARIARQYFKFGRVKGEWWQRGADIAPRQAALLAAPLAVAGAALAGLRRFGARPTIAALAALGALADVAGGQRGVRAPLHVRVLALALNGLIAASWWIGVVAGSGQSKAGDPTIRLPKPDEHRPVAAAKGAATPRR